MYAIRSYYETGFDAGMHAGDQLELRLAEVRGDVRMRQRRAECGRVGRERELAIRTHAQAFLFQPAPDAAEDLRRQRAEALFEGHALSLSWRGAKRSRRTRNNFV